MKLPVYLNGTVEAGKKMGRRLGFPTANISYCEKAQQLERGVYIAKLTLPCGSCINGVANVGLHPTLPEGPPTIEIHLLNFCGEIYKQSVTIELLKFLRPEIRFPDSEALRKQVFEDIKTTENYFSEKEDIC
ncbi:MAG: riboflavin kinase [Eubacteriales bacterium]|nr:riboflavin kinase [Eubacteriales bacterium]